MPCSGRGAVTVQVFSGKSLRPPRSSRVPVKAFRSANRDVSIGNKLQALEVMIAARRTAL